MTPRRKYTADLRIQTLPEIHTLVRFYAETESKTNVVVMEEYIFGVRDIKKDWDNFYPHLDFDSFISENYGT